MEGKGERKRMGGKMEAGKETRRGKRGGKYKGGSNGEVNIGWGKRREERDGRRKGVKERKARGKRKGAGK
jgi:hypothetical protein